MNRSLLLLFLGLTLHPLPYLNGQESLFNDSGQTTVSPNSVEPVEGGLSPSQDSLFDELMKQVVVSDPGAKALIEERPEEAAEMVETEEDSDLLQQPFQKRPITATFIQLTRESAKLTGDDWRQSLALARNAGISTIIIQWTATDSVAFFQPAPEHYTETYPIINELLPAAREEGVSVVLGLSHDSTYWSTIETRDDVLDVYFRVRNTENLRLQEALLEAFGDDENWTGYYLSEEIDDINWREPSRESVFHQFLLRSGRIIDERDEDRPVSISAFFRKRTAPSTFAENLRDLMNATSINQILIQDGIGIQPLGTPLIEPYYQELLRAFIQPPPNVGIVVELFESTSPAGEPFSAQTALPRRIERQLRDASLLQAPITIFSLFNYADPRRDEKQKAAYEVIRAWNEGIAEPSEASLFEGETTEAPPTKVEKQTPEFSEPTPDDDNEEISEPEMPEPSPSSL